MEKLNAVRGFTQSDEITVLVPPAPVVRGAQQAHPNNGRVQKICSNSAAIVTSMYIHRLHEMAAPGTLKPEHLPTFDCRIGAYASYEEAMSLIYWRVADCGMNAVSDAVYHLKQGAGHARTATTDVKLNHLKSEGKLPLHTHQAHGSFFFKVKRRKEGFNPKTQQPVICFRPAIEKASGNILRNVKNGSFPKDDEVGGGPHVS